MTLIIVGPYLSYKGQEDIDNKKSVILISMCPVLSYNIEQKSEGKEDSTRGQLSACVSIIHVCVWSGCFRILTCP